MKKAVTQFKMTLYNFNVLELNEKMQVVNQQGNYLDNFITDDLNFNLYAIDMFFVEVEYNKQLNEITNIKSFKGGYLLDKYSNFNTANF
jgi:hypothetical protein